MKREFLIICLLLLISIPAVKSLFIPGGFTSHDLTHHVIRQISMNKLLSEGQFPPRWSADLNNGYGYPVFLFNYPLPAMVGEVFHLTGLGFVDSVKSVLLFSMIISIIGMYLFLRSLLGSSLAAFLGAVFYLYAPLRFLNTYVSAAVGSALAVGLLPVIFYSLIELRKKKKWAILLGGISLAGLILAHNVTALISVPLILIFAYVTVRKKEVGMMFLLGLGLSAWFWLPALLEKQFTRFDLIFGSLYQDQFVSLWQLLRSPWGYGLSHPQHPEIGDMSYQLGLAHILVILVSSIWYLVSGRKVREVRVVGGFVLISFFLSVLLMLKISLPLWENLPFLSLVLFPLRFHVWSIFAASIAAALLVKYLPWKRMVFIALLGLVIYANRNHWHINEVFNPGEDYYLSLKTTASTGSEHLPKWGRVMEKVSPGKLEFVGGVGEVKLWEDKSDYVLAEVQASSSAKLRFNQIYFLGWEIKVDGLSASFNYLSDAESYGLPVFDVEAGKHTVLAEFKNTPMRNLADTLSIISLIIAGCFMLYSKKWKD